jgi:hypothetical protein
VNRAPDLLEEGPDTIALGQRPVLFAEPPRPALFVPAFLPASGRDRRRVDLTPESPARQLLFEALALGLQIEVEHEAPGS